MGKSKRIGECKGIEGKIDRAVMNYEKASVMGKDTRYKAQLVRKLRAIKRRCESDDTPELRFNGLPASILLPGGIAIAVAAWLLLKKKA